MHIVGLSGTNGSGKDTIGQLLVTKRNFMLISVTELLRQEAKHRGLESERSVLRTISAEWRRDKGLGVLIDKAIQQYKSSDKQYDGVAISSLRNPGEADRVHELGGSVVWVDAKPELRYKRIFARHRTVEDNKSYEEFLQEEQDEMQRSGDEATLNMAGVRDKSDVVIVNNFESLEELNKHSTSILNNIFGQ